MEPVEVCFCGFGLPDRVPPIFFNLGGQSRSGRVLDRCSHIEESLPCNSTWQRFFAMLWCTAKASGHGKGSLPCVGARQSWLAHGKAFGRTAKGARTAKPQLLPCTGTLSSPLAHSLTHAPLSSLSSSLMPPAPCSPPADAAQPPPRPCPCCPPPRRPLPLPPATPRPACHPAPALAARHPTGLRPRQPPATPAELAPGLPPSSSRPAQPPPTRARPARSLQVSWYI
jgi:hypothetical protein